MITETKLFEHARFGPSLFTFLGRNDAILSLLNSSMTMPRTNRITLLGSGPTEPITTALNTHFGSWTVSAVDKDPKVIELLRKGLWKGYLRLDQIAEVCRASDTTNDQFSSQDLISHQVREASEAGVKIPVKFNGTVPTLDIDARVAHRIDVHCLDLQKQLPSDLGCASIVFEGYMLSNWIKSEYGAQEISPFLSGVARHMQEHAWFASAESITLYERAAVCGRSFLSRMIEARLLPLSGLLGRWAVNTKGEITSQFIGVFSKSISNEINESNLIEKHRDISRQELLDLHLPWREELVNLEGLCRAIDSGDFFAFWREGSGRYTISLIQWNALSKRAQATGRALRFLR